jgi:hypothetical protein
MVEDLPYLVMMEILLMGMDAAALVKFKMDSIVLEGHQPEEILAVNKHQTKLYFLPVDNLTHGDKL